MSDAVYLTQEGYDDLKKELHVLRTQGRSEMAKQIAEAREKGDLSENAEYDAAKEAQGLLEMKIAKLEDTLGRARVLDKSKIDTSKVVIMSKVRIKHLKMNKEMSYFIVSENEANHKAGKISVKSPIGKGLLGHKVGEVVDVQTPGGVVQFEILEISM